MSATQQPEEPRGARGRVAWLTAAVVVSLALGLMVSVGGRSLARSTAIRANYDRIEVGTTTVLQVDLLDPSMVSCSSPVGSRTTTWTFENWVVTVEFDDDGVVRGKSMRPRSRPFAERVESLLETLWPF
jgi:hypothetical protein